MAAAFRGRARSSYHGDGRHHLNVIRGGTARSTQWMRRGGLDRDASEDIDSNQEISVLDFFSRTWCAALPHRSALM
jgi:hypothetical protein